MERGRLEGRFCRTHRLVSGGRPTRGERAYLRVGSRRFKEEGTRKGQSSARRRESDFDQPKNIPISPPINAQTISPSAAPIAIPRAAASSPSGVGKVIGSACVGPGSSGESERPGRTTSIQPTPVLRRRGNSCPEDWRSLGDLAVDEWRLSVGSESEKRSRIAASESMMNIFLHPPDDQGRPCHSLLLTSPFRTEGVTRHNILTFRGGAAFRAQEPEKTREVEVCLHEANSRHVSMIVSELEKRLWFRVSSRGIARPSSDDPS